MQDTVSLHGVVTIATNFSTETVQNSHRIRFNGA